jgi:hypothetical protein
VKLAARPHVNHVHTCSVMARALRPA